MEIRREITSVKNCYPPHGLYWQVSYQVWDHNGRNLGARFHLVCDTPDEAGAMLKTLVHWSKLDARNERRRKKKEQADGV